MDFGIWLKYFQQELAPRYIAESSYVVKDFNLAGKNIRLHFADTELIEKFTLALRHSIAKQTVSPDLDIYIWQRNHTNKDIPAFVESEIDQSVKFNGHFSIEQNSISIFQPEDRRAFFWINDANQLRDWVYASPLRTIFHWYFLQHNIYLLHGAVVGNDNGAVLITAKGGSGKSTTAMACLQAGMNYLSDDYIAISSETLDAYCIYSSLKIVPNKSFLSDKLALQIWNKVNNLNDKAIVFLSEQYSEQIKIKSKIKAILLPEITPSPESEIISASKVDALLAILPTTLRQNKLFESQSSAAIKQIVANLPCYKIKLGSNLNSITTSIAEFLARTS